MYWKHGLATTAAAPTCRVSLQTKVGLDARPAVRAYHILFFCHLCSRFGLARAAYDHAVARPVYVKLRRASRAARVRSCTDVLAKPSRYLASANWTNDIYAARFLNPDLLVLDLIH